MITYEEKIKREAKKDKPDAHWLALELLLHYRTCMLYEEKIKEILTDKEFEAFSTEVAKKVFLKHIANWQDERHDRAFTFNMLGIMFEIDRQRRSNEKKV